MALPWSTVQYNIAYLTKVWFCLVYLDARHVALLQGFALCIVQLFLPLATYLNPIKLHSVGSPVRPFVSKI